MKATLLVLAFLVGAACGSKSAPDKCNDFVKAVCSRAKSCGFTSSVSSCQRIVAEDFDCSRFKDVSDNYNDCMDEAAHRDCDDVLNAANDLTLPPSCKGVFIVK